MVGCTPAPVTVNLALLSFRTHFWIKFKSNYEYRLRYVIYIRSV